MYSLKSRNTNYNTEHRVALEQQKKKIMKGSENFPTWKCKNYL